MIPMSPIGGPWARFSALMSKDGHIVMGIEAARDAKRLLASSIPANIEAMVLLAADSFTQRSLETLQDCT